MAKYFDKIGFAVTEEVDPVNRPGIYKDTITEKPYYGDEIVNMTSKWIENSQKNDDLRITNKISIVADAYADQHFHSIKYLWYHGIRWKVTHVEVSRPRLILTTGGEYHDSQGA